MKSFKSTSILSLVSILLLQFSLQSDIPKYWYLSGSLPGSYKAGIDNTVFRKGNKSILIESLEKNIEGFATVMQTCNARDYLGTTVKMTGYIKSENVASWAGMWLRVDSADTHVSLAFDNMQDRPVTGTSDWTKYEIVLDVPKESGTLNFGVLLSGTGKIWVDNFSFEIVGNKPDAILTGMDLINIPERPENLSFEE